MTFCGKLHPSAPFEYPPMVIEMVGSGTTLSCSLLAALNQCDACFTGYGREAVTEESRSTLTSTVMLYLATLAHGMRLIRGYGPKPGESALYMANNQEHISVPLRALMARIPAEPKDTIAVKRHLLQTDPGELSDMWREMLQSICGYIVVYPTIPELAARIRTQMKHMN